MAAAIAKLRSPLLLHKNSNKYKFMKLLKGTGVTPAYRDIGDSHISVDKYFSTLGSLIDEKKIDKKQVAQGAVLAEKIDKLIDIMHSKGILHGDLHAENIVVSEDLSDVRIIDFGESVLTKDIDEEKIKYFVDFWGVEDEEINNIEDLKAYEKTMWRIGYA